MFDVLYTIQDIYHNVRNLIWQLIQISDINKASYLLNYLIKCIRYLYQISELIHKILVYHKKYPNCCRRYLFKVTEISYLVYILFSL